MTEDNKKKEIIKEIDEYHEKGDFYKIFNILKEVIFLYPEDIEILWRISRAYFDIAELKIQDKNWQKENFFKGLEYANKALLLYPNHYASNKWWAILTSKVGDFLSTKEKIGNAFKIKEHALKAAELKPDDSTIQFLLGQWCFSVANISWLERKMASALFSNPPQSSYEEALTYFEKCIELQSDFIRATFMLGEVNMVLKKPEKAKEWYQKTLNIPSKSEFDNDLQKQAKIKLSKL